jgi:hypothetical protein
MDQVYNQLKILMEEGTYANLLTEITRIDRKDLKPSKSHRALAQIANKYGSRLKFSKEKDEEQDQTLLTPEIIISESFE